MGENYIVRYKKIKKGSVKPTVKGKIHNYTDKNGTKIERKYQVDKEQNKYDETVTSNGEMTHECHEPLSKHTGHGSKKKSKK